MRLFVHYVPPSGVAVAGKVVADSGQHAPYFTALMLQGRPVEQRHRLLGALTDLLIEVLGVDRSGVRGMITEVDPDGWGIGGAGLGGPGGRDRGPCRRSGRATLTAAP